jgi:hypothetical protein
VALRAYLHGALAEDERELAMAGSTS